MNDVIDIEYNHYLVNAAGEHIDYQESPAVFTGSGVVDFYEPVGPTVYGVIVGV